MPKTRTRTASFGTPKRESHDASAFYGRNLYSDQAVTLFSGGETIGQVARGEAGHDKAADLGTAHSETEPPETEQGVTDQGEAASSVAPRPLTEWADRIYCHSSEHMRHVPDGSVALAFTSPPYNAGKDYDLDLGLGEYLDLIGRVAVDVYRVLKPGGRYVVNIANLGRKPYIPMHAYFYARHMAAGFLPAGEVIWRKSKGANGNCAWGSWMSASAPRLRDVHEYLLVFAKGDFRRTDKGESDIGRDEFMEATLSVWEIPPERAKAVGHPAPFPVALAERVIRLYSFVGDVVLDPFNGSGSTCVAAAEHDRRYVGYDISPEYCALAERRLQAVKGTVTDN